MEQKQQQRQREKELSFLVIGCKCVVERLDRKRGKSNEIHFLVFSMYKDYKSGLVTNRLELTTREIKLWRIERQSKRSSEKQ